MGWQWTEQDTREWLLRELADAVQRAQQSDDGDPAGDIAHGEAQAMARVLQHIFDNVDVELLDEYLGQLDPE